MRGGRVLCKGSNHVIVSNILSSIKTITNTTELGRRLLRELGTKFTFGVVGVLLSETEPLLSPPGRSKTRSGVCLFLCSLEGSEAVDGLGL